MSGPSKLLTANGRSTLALIANLSEHLLKATVSEEPEIDLRAPSSDLDRLEELEKHYSGILPLNEVTLAPRLIKISKGGAIAKLNLAYSNYARFLAAAEIFGELPENEQINTMTQNPLGTPPWLSHSLGVNCSLETSDSKLLWMRRSAGAQLEANRIAAVMTEGAKPSDVTSSKWDPESTARRGFHEELGFPLLSGSQLRLKFHSIFAQFGNAGISVAGHAVTTLSLQEVLEQHHDAMDASEHSNGLFTCDADPDAVVAFVDSFPLDEWSTWGTGNLWNLMSYRLEAELDGLTMSPFDLTALADKG